MCGISGFNWRDERKIEEMVSCLSYRGPDAEGVYTDDKISLGHNRLSIIDLSQSANQPMVDDKNELVIIFNGEIYNFQELKKELEREYPFKTKSDTEVILAGYRKWGTGVAKRLNGMFSFAIWDKRDSTLFCARDHGGMKPFYYYWNGEKFIFASEIPSIFTHDVPRRLNRLALNHYMRILYVPAPMTMIEDIYKLPPGHTLTLKEDKLSIAPYEETESLLEKPLPYVEATRVLRGKVLAAVERHLAADVPVGVYLSGGIDSSAVLFAASQFKKNIKTFNIGFELENKEESEKFNRDFELAKRTAAFFGTEHHSVVISPEVALESLEEASIHNSDPVSNPTSIAMLALSKFARSMVTVTLTGNAGDELFGGYERYRIALGAHYYKKLPGFVRSVLNNHPKLAKLDYKDLESLFAQFMFEKDGKLSRVMKQEAFENDAAIKKYYKDHYLSGYENDPVRGLMNADQKSWLPEYFFMLSDKMSMANGLEERMPLYDKELLTFSRSLPTSYKVDMFRTKKILKDAFKNDLPEFLFHQPKMGWFAPAAKWFRNPAFHRKAKEILSEGYYSGTKALFDWPEVHEMLEQHVEKKEYNLTLLWALVTFQTWAKVYNVEI